MFDSISGLVVAFILLAIVTAWNTIRTRGWLGLKFVSIGILIWYGFVVYFTIPQIMGWPTGKDLPANSKIISVRIIEPSTDNKEGAMYFWMSQKPDHKLDALNLLRPDKFLIYTGNIQPRSYKIPYDRELHKKLLEAQKKQQSQRGSTLMTGEKGVKTKEGGEGRSPTENPFKILNPFTFLNKDGGE